jgi:hypothetical protein
MIQVKCHSGACSVARFRAPRFAQPRLPDRTGARRVTAAIGEVHLTGVASGMADVTFRDFAAAIMKGDGEAAGAVLEALLGLPAADARGAAQYFQARSAAQGPAFMGKAMGLRTAVAGGSEPDIAALLRDCFGLADAPLAAAVAALRRPPA